VPEETPIRFSFKCGDNLGVSLGCLGDPRDNLGVSLGCLGDPRDGLGVCLGRHRNALCRRLGCLRRF